MMRMNSTQRAVHVSSALLLGSCLLGCSDDDSRPPRRPLTNHADDGHGHERSVPLANFPLGHVELAKAPTGALELHILDLDTATALPITATALDVEATNDSGTRTIAFTALPLPGEAPRSSRFRSPERSFGEKETVELATYLPIDGKNYRIRFPKTNSEHGGGHGAPIARTAADEELWFTPKGKYTAADIAANGALTAYEKYAGIEVDHADPNPGEIVCPISKSRSNPKITWAIDGKLYAFCCPPCIEDMVQRAKDDPDSILPPEAYTKP